MFRLKVSCRQPKIEKKNIYNDNDNKVAGPSCEAAKQLAISRTGMGL